MFIHTRTFVGDLPVTPRLDVEVRDGMAIENLTARYAPTQVCTVKTAPGAQVVFSVVNMAARRPIAQRVADESGTVRLRLGLGSVHVTAQGDGFFAEALWDTRDGPELRLEGASLPKLYTFASPKPPETFPAPLAPEQKAERDAVLAKAASLRKIVHAKPAQGPLALLTEKDRSEEIDPRIFDPNGMSPRIGLEPLQVWQSPDVGEAPLEIWQWVQALDPLLGYRELPQSPLSALKLGAAGESGKDVLFCGICRKKGIPARLSPLDGEPEYEQDGTFVRVREPASARLRLRAPDGRGAVCGQDYTLSRWHNGAWKALRTGDLSAGKERDVAVPPGTWRLLTVVRLPSGDQLCREEEVTLAAGEERELALAFPQAESAQLLQCLPLPAFPGRELLQELPLTLLCWLEPGREPTEHLLLELREQEAGFAACREKCAVHLLTPEDGGFDELPALARQLFVDPERLPLVLLADQSGRGLYACSGYNVGVGALLLRLIEAADNILE